MVRTAFLIAAAGLAIATSPVAAQRRTTPAKQPVPDVQVPPPAYPFHAELVLASPAIVDATIRSATRIRQKDAPDTPPGMARFYVEAQVMALVRGTDPLPPRIGYLLDLPLDAKGRAPKVARQRVMIFARTVPGRFGQMQLVRPDAQRVWSQPLDTLVRRITAESISADAPPEITGVANAFHTPGALPGEGESQIFLNTSDGRPVSVIAVRQPGEPVRLSVALSEIVDQNVPPPPRDTLLWYRLACFLPATLPRGANLSEGRDAERAAEDYAIFMRALGPCDRSRAQ